MRSFGAAIVVMFSAVLALVLSPSTTRGGAPTGWPQATSDLAANPDVTFGVLPNGMLYAIRHNDQPTGEVSMQLVIEAGSMQETHDQEGLAHLLEHMAFRGSTHVPDGEVIKTLERLGLNFGGDANAFTDKEATRFHFDMAHPDAQSVDTGLSFLREIGSELTLSQDALDSERRVVLAEARQRAGPAADLDNAQSAEEFPGHPFARPTIGRTEVVEKATPAQLRTFYDAYYRPERAVLVVVGDVDPPAIEAKIKALFSDWRGRGPAGGDPPPYQPTARGRTVVASVVPGAPTTALSLIWVPTYRAADQSRAGRIDEIIRSIGEGAVSRRVFQMAQDAGRPFAQGGFGGYSFTDVARGESLGARGISNLPATVDVLLKAQRGVLEQGITQTEVDRVVEATRADLQHAAAGSAGPSPFIANRLAGEAASGSIDLSEQQRLDLFEATVKGLTAERVNAALRAQFAGEGPIVFFATDAPRPAGKPTLEAMLDSAAAAPLAAYVPPAAKPWTHTDFGPPGVVVERREVADLGVTMVRFANGVRLSIIPTKFAEGRMQVAVRFGHGQLDQPGDRLDASDMSTSLLSLGGLDDLKLSDIALTTLGHPVSAFASTDEDAFTLAPNPFSPTLASADLELEMQYLAATMTAPGWRADDWNTFLASSAQSYRAQEATAGGVFNHNYRAILHPGDQRWVVSTPEMWAAWSQEQARAFLEPILKHSEIEVIIAGDVTPEQAIAAVAKTFGALPRRDGLPEPAAAHADAFPAPTATPVVLHHGGGADMAMADISWPTNGRYAVWDDIAPTVILADIIRLRVIDQLRTATGETYSPNTGAECSLVYPTWGRVALSVPCKPDAVDRVYATIDAIAADLAAHPVSDDELQRAVRPDVQIATHMQQQNSYWIAQLAGAQTDPRRLDYIRQTLPRLSGVTAADVQRVAKRWLRPDRAFRIEVIPTPAALPAGGKTLGQPS